LVTGLFNNTETVGSTTTSNSAAVRVFVELDGKPVLPDSGPFPGSGIIYDQRFQQLSPNTFGALATCALTNNCSPDLVESTLAAHSFDFVAPNVGGGTHQLAVSWFFECTSNGADTPCSNAFTVNTAGACAGPGTVTVTQTKAFTQSGGVTF
jgi:hypothetical protein